MVFIGMGIDTWEGKKLKIKLSIMATQTLSAKNKAFWKKKPSQQRVEVAKDVLKQLELKFLKAERQTYFAVSGLKKDIENPSDKLDQVFDQVFKSRGKCNVCGIGACFVSMVKLGNSIATKQVGINGYIENGDSIDDDDMRKLLENVFSEDQLSLIECAFERDLGFGYAPMLDQEAAKSFGEKYKHDSTRLKAIMKNIIKNKGEFIP